MSVLNSVETEYLLCVLRAAVNGETAAAPPVGIDWNQFFALSKKQEVYSMVAQSIDYSYLPPDIARELNDQSKSELVRLIAMQNELKAIEEQLEKNEIRYMLLKGSVIRNYYPKQSMRQMSDIDIMYDPQKRDILLEIMKKRGYKMKSDGDNSDDFVKAPYYTFEFHRDLFKDVYGFCPDFSFVWDHAERSAEKPFEYIMCAEDLYLFHIAHMYKHGILGGFGVRFLVDTYLILKKNPDMDTALLHQQLGKLNLSDFEEKIRSLSFSVMEDKALTEEQTALLNDIIQNSIFGAADNIDIAAAYEAYNAANGGGVLGYLKNRIFPSKQQMQSMYPQLKEKEYLLPYYYFKRLFKNLFTSFSKGVKEVREIRNIANKEK